MAKLCGAKTRAGGRCKQTAGWGTDHVGEGRCKLHGGAAKRGADSPRFKHGMYAEHVTPKELLSFEDFVARHEFTKASPNELWNLYKAHEVLTAAGFISLPVRLKAANDIVNWKAKYYEIEHGKKETLEIVFSQPEIEALVDLVASIILKYVPEEKQKAALDEFNQRT
jgi:hypothetical protein